MAVLYNSLHVDEKYKSIILPNLFYKTFLIPGVTYQDIMSENNGAWYWHKLTSSGAAAPGTPGRDFTDEAAADTLVQCIFNNNFQKSKKIYGVQAAAVQMPVAEEHLALAVNEVAEGKNLSALACLISEGTAASATTEITASTVSGDIVAVRKEIVKAKGTADVVLCSPDFFATILEAAGSKFLPVTNEKIIAAAGGGQIGSWLGMLWIECNGLSSTSNISYYSHAGTKVNVTAANLANVDFIMYDHNAFGCGDNFNIARLVDSENFAGTKAQTEDNVGFRVLESACVRVRKHVESSSASTSSASTSE